MAKKREHSSGKPKVKSPTERAWSPPHGWLTVTRLARLCDRPEVSPESNPAHSTKRPSDETIDGRGPTRVYTYKTTTTTTTKHTHTHTHKSTHVEILKSMSVLGGV